jgi:hypothetical protein
MINDIEFFIKLKDGTTLFIFIAIGAYSLENIFIVNHIQEKMHLSEFLFLNFYVNMLPNIHHSL